MPLNNKSLLKNLHPITIISYCAILAAFSMIYTNPLYLFMLFLITLVNIFLVRSFKELKFYLLISLPIALLIIVINPLISNYGSTIIWRGPIIPVFGRITISFESLMFSLTMALKLILIISIFCLYNAMMDQDKALSFFSRFAPKSAVTIIMSALMVPKMKRDLIRISSVMYTRGARFDDKSIVSRIRSRYPILKILLLSSLEGSWDVAEAMHARGFASGKRAFYQAENIKVKDLVVIAGVVFSFLGFIFGLGQKKGIFSFYPTCNGLFDSHDVRFMCWIFSGILILPVFNIIWQRWKFLRLRT